jgi:cysteine-rich repeat protein
MKCLLLTFATTLIACASPETDGTHQASLSQRSVGDCTYTQGYWKNHPNDWPVTSVRLGNIDYSQSELLDIFHTPVTGNGLISVSHQLIAAKLNIASGANPAALGSAIASTDTMIGMLVVPSVGLGALAPEQTSDLNDQLDDFNTGAIGPGHCADHLPPASCGDGLLEGDEVCDDGNNVDGDGCTATCQHECEYICGNGDLEPGEQCDDGNAVNGDGCSSACTSEDIIN